MLSKHKDDDMELHYDENIDYLIVLNKADLVSNKMALQMKEILANKGVTIHFHLGKSKISSCSVFIYSIYEFTTIYRIFI